MKPRPRRETMTMPTRVQNVVSTSATVISAKPAENSSRPPMIMVEAGIASAIRPAIGKMKASMMPAGIIIRPASKRREADDGLHEHRHDVGRAHHAGAEDEGDQRGGGEFDVGEDAHVEQGARRMELPQHEGHAGRRADHQPQDDGVGAPALALAVGDAGHQAEQRRAQRGRSPASRRAGSGAGSAASA